MGTSSASILPAELSHRVMRAMVQHRVPATPQNYHVWYVHFSRIDTDLSRAVDAWIHSGKSFSQEINDDLYKTYILPKYTDERVRRIQEDMQAILKDVMESVSTVGEATADYNAHLEISADRLAQSPEMVEVRGILRQLANKTIGMARKASESQQSLQAATAQIVTLNEQLKETEQAVLQDPLTGLFNRKATEQRLRELEAVFRRESIPFSVVMADIDHFKKFNDTFGHQVGDAVLRLVGKVLKDSVKGKDFVARYGGEEFIALLPGTSCDCAGIVAQQIREAVQAQRLRIVRTEQEIPTITLSLGVAQFMDGDTSESVVQRADQALYFAKRSGRNNVKTELELPRSA